MKTAKTRTALKTTISVIVIITIALICAFYFAPSRSAKKLLDQRSSGTVYEVEQTAPFAVAGSPLKFLPPTKAPIVFQPLLDRYNDGRNMRSFVHEALQHPELGGNFYASKVLRQCAVQAAAGMEPNSAPISETGEDAAVSLKTSQAADRLRMRCADFLADELSNKRIDEIWKSGTNKDPLIKSMEDYLGSFKRARVSADSVGVRKAALESILKLGDPMLLQDLGPRLALDMKDGKRGFYIGGDFYGLDSETDVGLAIYLLPCSQGLKCDANEFDTASRCASGVGCDSSRFEYAEKLKQSVPGAYAKVLAMYEAMGNAARAGDAGFFSRPR